MENDKTEYKFYFRISRIHYDDFIFHLQQNLDEPFYQHPILELLNIARLLDA